MPSQSLRRRFSRLAPRALPLLLALGGLSACGTPETEADLGRPVLVQQPEAAAGAVQAFAGEVRARHETPLAFRVRLRRIPSPGT